MQQKKDLFFVCNINVQSLSLSHVEQYHLY